MKEGKVFRKDGAPLPGEDEPLHALVSSTKIENVKKAVAEIHQIIKAVSFYISFIKVFYVYEAFLLKLNGSIIISFLV